MKFLPVVVAALALGACSSNLLKPGGGAQTAERQDLQQRVIDLQRQVTVNEFELARLRERVAELEAGETGHRPRSSRPTASSPPPSSRPADLPEVEVRLPERGGAIEEDDLEPVSTSPSVGSGSVSSAPAPQRPADSGPSRPLPPPTAVAGAPLSESAQRLYDEGYTHYHQGRYVDAETAFRRYLQQYPDTGLSDNANFWIGAARYARQDYSGALDAFRETIERYPDGNKVPDSLLKIGQVYEKLGDRAQAGEAYDAVTSRFPGSAAAVLAEEYRAALR